MLIPEAEPFRRELSTFLNSLKYRFSDVKDLQIGSAGGRLSKAGRGTLLKGSNTTANGGSQIFEGSTDSLLATHRKKISHHFPQPFFTW